MSSREEPPAEAGHEFIYRLTAVGREAPPESRYFLTAHETLSWTGHLEKAGFRAHAAVAPASAFQELSVADLEALALRGRGV